MIRETKKILALLVGVSVASHIEIPISRVPYKTQSTQHSSKKLGDVNDIEVPIEMAEAYRYMGPMYFGTSSTQANVTFDTGSTWVSVTSTLCTNCPSEVYSQASSSQSIDLQEDYSLEYSKMGMTLQADKFTDRVCLTEDNCVQNFEFYAVSNQTGMPAYSDGVLGLQPVVDGDSSSGPSYLKALKDSNTISRAIFGFYLQPQDLYSNIQIGNYNSSYINGTDADIVWQDSKYTDSWTLEGYTNYGDEAHETTPTEYLIDSGNRKIGFPTTMWSEFAQVLQGESDSIFCDSNTCYGRESNCTVYGSLLQDLTITFGSDSGAPQFTVPAKRLMVTQGITYPCELGVYNSGATGVLGDLFLFEYYTIYDMDYNKIGLAPAIQYAIEPTPEPSPTPTPIPDKDDDDDDKKEDDEEATRIIAILMLTACLGVVIGTAVYIRHKRKQEVITYHIGPAYDEDGEMPRSSSTFRETNSSQLRGSVQGQNSRNANNLLTPQQYD